MKVLTEAFCKGEIIDPELESDQEKVTKMFY